MAEAYKALKFKVYNNDKLKKTYENQTEILRKIWNFTVAIAEYCDLNYKQKKAFNNGYEYTSPKCLDYYLNIVEVIDNKYPGIFDDLYTYSEKDKKEYPFTVSKTSKKQKIAKVYTKLKKLDETKHIFIKNDKIINSASIEAIAHRYGDALCAHNSRKGVKKTSKPKFIPFGKFNAIKYRKININVNAKKIKLTKQTSIKLFNHEYLVDFSEKCSSSILYAQEVSLSRECDGLYAIFCIKYDDENIVPSQKDLKRQEKRRNIIKTSEVGADLGVVKFITLSDGKVIENPKYLKMSENKLKSIQRKLSRKAKTTPKEVEVNGEIKMVNVLSGKQTVAYKNTKKELSKLHTKIKRQRKEFINTTIDSLDKNYDSLVFEDLKISNMTKRAKAIQDECGTFLPNGQSRKSGLNKSILDASFSSFIDTIVAKLGDRVSFVNPQYTSQTCSCCGNTNKENRKTQDKFICIVCGYNDNADVNAAKNILAIKKNNKKTIKEVYSLV